MFSEKALRAAAKELNEVLDGLDPPINTKASIGVITEAIKEIIEKDFIDPETDELSEATQAIIDELTASLKKEKPGKGKKSKAKEEEPEDDDDDADDDDAEEAEESELKGEVEEATKLAQLKTLVKENDEFKTIRGELSAYKDVEELREDMLDLLDQEAEEAEEVAEKLHKKNVADKKVSTGKKAKEEPEDDDEDEEEEEEKKPKKAAKKGGGQPPQFKREGSMAEFMDETAKAGGSWEEILAVISKEAKRRGVKTTLSTIKAHVRFRVSKDPKFLGKKKVSEDGIE